MIHLYPIILSKKTRKLTLVTTIFLLLNISGTQAVKKKATITLRETHFELGKQVLFLKEMEEKANAGKVTEEQYKEKLDGIIQALQGLGEKIEKTKQLKNPPKIAIKEPKVNSSLFTAIKKRHILSKEFNLFIDTFLKKYYDDYHKDINTPLRLNKLISEIEKRKENFRKSSQEILKSQFEGEKTVINTLTKVLTEYRKEVFNFLKNPWSYENVFGYEGPYNNEGSLLNTILKFYEREKKREKEPYIHCPLI